MTYFTSTITQKGQVTIPAKFRKKFGIKTNSVVRISEDLNGVKIEVVNDAEALAGILYNSSRKPLSIKDLSQIRAKGLFFPLENKSK